MSDLKQFKKHGIISDNRENARISGVSEVLSFDENRVLCKTELGILAIKGAELRVSNLNTDTGDLNVDGLIDSFLYEGSAGLRSGKSVIGRIFK